MWNGSFQLSEIETMFKQIKHKNYPTFCIFAIRFLENAVWNCPYTDNTIHETYCILRIRRMKLSVYAECKKIRTIWQIRSRIKTLGG
jgi:hypothetical protein